MDILTTLHTFILEYSYAAVFTIVTIESGLIIGAFLPGDSFLFLTGILAGKDILNIYTLLWSIVTAAFLGNELGYFLGKKYGWQAIAYFSKKYADPMHHKKAHVFYARWGVLAVIVARFIPVMRSLIPTVAGMADMQRVRFTIANAIGACLWGTIVTMVGYIAGDHLSNHAIIAIPALGFLAVGVGAPLATQWWHMRKQRDASAQKIVQE